jgi:tripartite-type tricarboxylate transporter receptor subunit TctC
MTGCHGASRLVRKTSLVLFAALIAALSAATRGETYPDRPIQLVVPAGAGSSTDTMMRSLAQVASPMLGQSIVILNKPGASGIIGVSYVTRSAPDGYTLAGVVNGALTMAPHVATANYQPSDYRIVAMITQAAGVLCVHPDFPADNAQQFLSELRSHPDKYTYGSDGVGAFVQFATARIFEPAGIRQRMIPYQGADQTVTAFLSASIDIYAGGMATIVPYVAEKKAKCLLTTTARHFAALPDVASLADVKMPQAETRLWRAVVAPRGMPQDRFDKLRNILIKAATTSEFKALAEKRGEEFWDISADEANKYVQDEFTQMQRLAQELHLKQD